MIYSSADIVTVSQDEMAIHTLLKKVVLALNRGDVEELLSLHSDDVILMEHNMPLLRGKQEIMGMFSHFQRKQIAHTISYQVHELEITSPRAFVRGSVKMTKTEPGKQTQHTKGKFICLLKKQPGGEWLRTHVIVNTDEPPV